jgi:flagellar FliL protein
VSDKKDKADKPAKKGGKLLKMVLAAGLLVGAGGGTAYALMSAGLIGGNHAGARESGPQLVLKGATDPYAPKSSKSEESGELVHGDGGSRYRTAYYTFAEDFTSNLRNSDALVQISLAASTHRDGRVLMWLKEHELAVRSRILITLADTPEEDMYVPDGKIRLQKRLTDAVNTVLTEQEGFGGVDNVYFRTFIVQ